MMKSRDDIQNSNKKRVNQFMSRGLDIRGLCENAQHMGCQVSCYSNIFTKSLDSVNKGIADQLVQGDIMLQPFEVASYLLDGMARVNQAWYTKEDQVSPLCFRLTQEQLDKEKERDENIKKMLSQMEDLQEHIKGNCEVFHAERGSFSDNLKSGGN